MSRTRTRTRTPKAEPKVYVAPASRLPPYTEQVAGERLLALIVRKAEMMVDRGKTSCEKFVEKFQQDPANTLEWSRTPFEDVAAMKIGRQVLQLVAERPEGDDYSSWTDGRVAREVERCLMVEVLREARYPSRSTSVQANEMALSLQKARAEFLEEVRNLIAWGSWI